MAFNNNEGGFASGKVRHRGGAAVIWDTSGNDILFAAVSTGEDVMYVANHVPKMITRAIPLAPIFEKFGKNVVLKVTMVGPDQAMFTIIPEGLYSVSGSRAEKAIVVTHQDYKRRLGESSSYFDLVICVSYTDPTMLVLVPLEKTWATSSGTSKALRVVLIVMALAVVLGLCVSKVYYKTTNPLQEAFMVIIVLFKDYFVQLIQFV